MRSYRIFCCLCKSDRLLSCPWWMAIAGLFFLLLVSLVCLKTTQNGALIRMPFLKIAVCRTAYCLCYSLNNLQCWNNPRLLRTGSMKDNEKFQTAAFYKTHRRLAGGGFSSLHLLREKTTTCPPWRLQHLTVCAIAQGRGDYKQRFKTTALVWPLQAGRLARFLPACGTKICVARTVPKGS